MLYFSNFHQHASLYCQYFNGTLCLYPSCQIYRLALVTMILKGLSIKLQSESTTPATLSIAQLFKFNNVIHRWTATGSTPSSSQARHHSEDSNLHEPNAICTHTEEGALRQAGTHGDFYLLWSSPVSFYTAGKHSFSHLPSEASSLLSQLNEFRLFSLMSGHGFPCRHFICN